MEALNSMEHSSPDLVLVFASVRFDQEALLKGIVSLTKDAPLIGCSTAGEILPTGPSHRSVAVLTIKSTSLELGTGLGRGLSAHPRQAGYAAASQAIQAKLQNPHLFLLFPDGLSGNIAEVIRGTQDVLGLSFPIVGGSAGDDLRFMRTYQYFQGQVHSDAVAGVLLAGPILVGVGARHGWQPLGKPKQVTRALGNTLMELDGKPATHLYENYFNTKTTLLRNEELAHISIMYPLGFPIPGEEEYLLRNAIRTNADGSLTLTGEIPEGSEVRLMMGSKAKALEASRRAAEQALRAIAPHSPHLALAFSCISRAQLFGRDLGSELTIIQKVLGKDVPLVGFYDYGEQAPLSATNFRGKSYFHNESAVVVTLSSDITEQRKNSIAEKGD